MLAASAFSTITGRQETVLFGRRITNGAVRKAVAVVGMFLSILFLSTLLLCAFTDAPFMDVAYETVSATATVGLTRALTPLLDTAGKMVIIATMYLGRIGPISLAIALGTRKQGVNSVKNPTEDISVG